MNTYKTSTNREYADDCLFQKSILITTLSNDPDTLKVILNWGKTNQMKHESPTQIDENPILLASLEGYTKCMKKLYEAGFRIHLLEEDWKGVKDQTKKNRLKFLSLQSLGFETQTAEDSVERKSFSKKITDALKRLVIKEEMCSNDEDPVNRYLRFKAYANQDYLSLELIFMNEGATVENIDPLRKAFALGTYAKLLAEYHSEHSKEYKMIGEHCEKFATEILAHCHNAKDVMTLLRYDPMEEHSDEYKYGNWHLALWGEHKSFVAHPYYQHFAWKRLKGTHYDPYKTTILGRGLSIPFALLLVLLYIPVILMDLVFREGQLLWETPGQFRARKLGRPAASRMNSLKELSSGRRETPQEECVSVMEAEEAFENRAWGFFRERLHRPVFRMYSMLLCELLFLVFLYLGLTDPNNGYVNYTWVDIVTWTLIGHFFVEDLIELFVRRWDFFTSFWSCYTLFTNFLLLSGAAVLVIGYEDLKRTEDDMIPQGMNTKEGVNANIVEEKKVSDYRARLSGDHPVNIGMTMIAYGALMHVLRVLRWFLLNKHVGPVVVCFIRVIRDVVYVFAVFVVIYLAFVLGLWFMYKPFTVTGGGVDPETGKCSNESMYCIGDQSIIENHGMRGIISHIFWRVFDGDAKEDARVQNKTEYQRNESTVFSLEFSHFMGYSMWAMYQGLTVILLINILIAQVEMTDYLTFIDFDLFR